MWVLLLLSYRSRTRATLKTKNLNYTLDGFSSTLVDDKL